MRNTDNSSHTILMIALCFLPLLLIVIVYASGMTLSPWFFVLFLVLCFFGMYYAMGAHHEHEDTGVTTPEMFDEVSEQVLKATEDVIRPLASFRMQNHEIIEGPLLMPADKAIEILQERFEGTQFVPKIQESEAGRPMVILAPKEASVSHKRERKWINVALFFATILTTMWAGAAHLGINLLEQPGQVVEGIPYAAALLLILGTHELGHYFTARYYKMNVTLPYFIPIPFALGTFGAFIKLKTLPQNRKAMFDVALAGPIAGLIVAIPALLIGLQYSTVVTGSEAPAMFLGGAEAGSSVLFAFLAKATLGDAIQESHRIILHPIAFAGWLGLIVTGLNLIPVGQLDGGHIAHAVLGRRNAYTLGITSLFLLVVMGLFIWSGLLFWAIIIFFIAGTRDNPPINDVTTLDRKRVVLAACALAMLLLIVVPIPHAFYASFGIHCPYV